MDSKIIDPKSLFVNAEKCQRLSYEMLFNDSTYGNGHPENDGDPPSEQRSKTRIEHQRKIEQLEEVWKQKLEKAESTAYKQGLDEGREKGEQEARESMMKQLETAKDAIHSVNERIDGLMDDLKPHVATMVFEIAEKIIGIPVESKKLKEEVVSEVRKLLKAVEQDVKVKITVASTDYGFLIRALKDVQGPDHIDITGSDSLNTGEYAVDTQNERIVKNFKKMLHDFREDVALTGEIEPGDK